MNNIESYVKDTDSVMEAVGLLKALSNPKRLAILCRIGDDEVSAGTLADFTELSPSALSQHLARLKDKDIVSARRQQQTVYYSLNNDKTRKLIALLHELYCDRESAHCKST